MVLADSTLVEDVPTRIKRSIALAEECFSRVRFTNITMPGTLAAVSRLDSLETLQQCLEGNRMALKLGYEQGLSEKRGPDATGLSRLHSRHPTHHPPPGVIPASAQD